MNLSYFKPRKPFSFSPHPFDLGTFMGLWQNHDDNHFLLKIYKKLFSHRTRKVILGIEMTKQSLLQKGMHRRLKSYLEMTIFSAKKKTYPATQRRSPQDFKS